MFSSYFYKSRYTLSLLQNTVFSAVSAVYFEMHQKHSIDEWVVGWVDGQIHYKARKVNVNGRI